ncbi:hypothetical protein TWF506_001448 [Arthrobotrys conoides]|uniref:Mitochondrial division protein 1 n=1 Tax=Arthrobotrys conoides TaxID=74498 RepID=A0AAN8S1S9_9PEZI
MSGAEFVAVAAVASSIIAIIDGITKVVQAASDAHGLPPVFRKAESKLEIISDILYATTAAFKKANVSAVDSTVQRTVKNCENSWQKLKVLFEKVIPEEGASRATRYRQAARTLGKGSKVELLMKDLMDNVNLLATLKIMTEGSTDEQVIETNPRKERFEEHIAEVARWEPSLSDNVFEEAGYSLQVSGTGHNVAHGENAQQFVSRDNAQNIGSIHGGYHNNNTTYFSLNEIVTPDETDQACLESLQCPDMLAIKTRLQETKDGLVFESIKWIFENKQYIDWRFGEDISLLLIRGGAGKGKTMLSIRLIDELSSDAVVAFFFCQNADYKLNTIEAVIKGWIRCLANQREEALRALRNYWNAETKSFTNGTSWRALWDIFRRMLEQCECPRIYVIVDALDECRDPDPDMADFLNLLVKTGLGQSSRIKWLLTSRPLDIVQQKLLTRPNQALLSLEDNINSQFVIKGIKTYITKRVVELNNHHDYGPQLLHEIKERLTQKAGDTYMWASLVCKKLENTRRRDILATINDSPRGLNSFYQRALDQINTGDPILVRRCTRIIRAVMLAYRPLTLDELSIVADLSTTWVTIDKLIDRCSSFIKKQETAKVIGFVHYSALEYLKKYGKFRIDYGDGEIALACLSHLSRILKVNLAGLPRPDSTRPRNLLKYDSNSLITTLDYPATFWAHHVDAAKRTTLIQNALSENGELNEFLRIKLLPWLECLSLLDRLWCAEEVFETLRNVLSVRDNPSLWTLMEDAFCFWSQNYDVVKIWPLQLYSCAIIFSPQTSAVREQNLDKLAQWLRGVPQAEGAQESLKQKFRDGSGRVAAIAFSTDGRKIVSISSSHTIELWDAATGGRQKPIDFLRQNPDSRGRNNSIAVAFSPDSKQVVARLGDTILLWDTVTGCHEELYKHPSKEPGGAVAFSRGGKRIACGFGNTLRVCSAITGDLQKTLIHPDSVSTAVFSIDDKRIASAYGSVINVWDAITGNRLKDLEGSAAVDTCAVVFLPDGERIASASKISIQFWNFRTGSFQRELKFQSELLDIMAISSDGGQVASGFADGAIGLWDITTMRYPYAGSSSYSTQVKTLALSPDGKQVASSSDNTIKLWSSTNGRRLQTLFSPGYQNSVALAFSPDSKRIVSGTETGSIMIWDIVPGNIPARRTFENNTGAITTIAFSPNGKQIAIGSVDSIIKVRDVRTGKTQLVLKDHDWVGTFATHTVAFSPNGRMIASGGDDSWIYLWDSTTGGLLRKFRKRSDFFSFLQDPVDEVAFSPNGKMIAGSSGRGIKLWKTTPSTAVRLLEQFDAGPLTTMSPIGRVRGPGGGFAGNIKFSRDSRSLETNRGRLDIVTLVRQEATSDWESVVESLGVRNDWICYGTMRVLRLPAWPKPTAYLVRGDVVVIGFEDGQVLSFSFDREQLYLMLKRSRQ